MLLVTFLVCLPLFTSAISVAGVDPKHDDLKLLKDQILGENRHIFTYGTRTYEVSSFQEPWHRAKYYCKWLGMDLVSIETAEENEAIVAAVAGLTAPYYYTSLNDNYIEGEFYWESTGETVGPYINWNSGQPFSGTSYNCAILSSTDGKWTSVSLTTNHKYICESRDLNCDEGN